MSRSLLLLAALLAACAPQTRSAWHESGESWRDSGRQLMHALGDSIAGEGSPKEEWRETGDEFRDAGRDTAEAVGSSIQPDGEKKSPGK